MKSSLESSFAARRLIRALSLFLLFFGLASSFASQVASSESDKRQAFTFRAEWFSGGDMTLRGAPYSDKYVALSPGPNPNNSRADYEIDFPETGDYELWAFFSAVDSRPLTIEFDGAVVSDKALGQTNGSWLTSASTWSKQVDLISVPAGKHVITIRAFSPDIPHFSAFRLIPKFDLKTNWGVPRPVAKDAIERSDSWKPSPWSGGWYEYIARDRYLRKESGETFGDHFARETSLALAPRSAITVEASARPFAFDLGAIDLFDELTYAIGMFPKTDAGETEASRADPSLYMRATFADSNDGCASRLPKSETFSVCGARYFEELDRAEEMIGRFRQDLGDAEYLPKTLEKIEALRDAGKGAFESYRINRDDASALKCAELYVESSRLYARVGWANPIIDFDKLLFVLRHATDLGLPQNYESNCVLNRNGFDDALETLSLPFVCDETNPAKVDEQIASDSDVSPRSSVLFKPDYSTFLGDIDLHFDAEKALVSSMSRERRWNVFEVDLNAARENKTTDETMKPVLPDFPDADSYDACYMPDDSVVFTSTACYIAVPCVSGSTRVTNTFKLDAKDGSIRRLTFDQEHNWQPTLTPDGRVMYLRWEYTDIPHVPGRLLFQMNPDGTNQRAHYGSNSLWPVSMMYARAIPDDPSKFCCVVTGHHGVARMGELVLFDVRKGRKETQGAVERICGYPKEVASRTDPKYHSTLWGDNIADESWPKYLHPFPLSEDYYLVASKPDRDALWGLYLVDRFDNMILLAENEGFACFEPTPLRETERPPVIQERVDLSKQDATVYCADVYFGDGLKGVPRGAVKYLRLYSYSYLYPTIGGATSIIGVDGPWDVRQTLGVVPVKEDGSALFKVPANVPIAIQPLDENGQALQQMRSWFTAMPGETLACVGCHEDENSTSSVANVAFKADAVDEIQYWNGPMRGFSFEREVQPVLDHYCVACHDGKDRGWGAVAFDLRGGNIIQDFRSALQTGVPSNRVGKFSTSYMNLQAFVRRPGIESDYFLLNPMEFSANTTELCQILANGHYELQMDADAWDRIITWIDMNAPYHGGWTEFAGKENVSKWNKLRKELLELYADFDDESEEARGEPYDPEKSGGKLELEWIRVPANPDATDWERQILREVAAGERAFPDGKELLARFEGRGGKLDAKAAQGKPLEPGWEIPNRTNWDRKARKTVVWNMSEPRLVPNDPNKKTLGPNDANVDVLIESDVMRVKFSPFVEMILKRIPPKSEGDSSLWVGEFEVTNAQFEVYDPEHDSRVESRQGLSHGFRGFFVNAPEQPVCRVSWDEAVAFCRWLSEKTNATFRLPSEEEWEYACRAGTTTPFNFGDWGADFSKHANLADQMLIEFIADNYFRTRRPLPNVTYYDDWVPKDRRFCDNGFLSEKPGLYLPNAWGLFDMHGNVSEWTSTSVRPRYGVEVMDSQGERRVAKGGSWRDRPYRAAVSARTTYYPWQRVFDVGFRVVCEESSELSKRSD